MRITGNVTHHHLVFDTIDGFLALGLQRGLGEELTTGRDVDETDVVEFRMTFGFHGKELSGLGRLTLTGFVTRLDLVDHIDAPLAADHLASGMALLG